MLSKRALHLIAEVGLAIKEIWKTSKHDPDAYWKHSKSKNDRCR